MISLNYIKQLDELQKMEITNCEINVIDFTCLIPNCGIYYI